MGKWLTMRLSAEPPLNSRCGKTESVRGAAVDPEADWRRCINCRHVTKKFTCVRCMECMDTEHLDRFEVDPWLAEDERFQYWMQHPKKYPVEWE